MSNWKNLFYFLALLLFSLPISSSAHEVYVLSEGEIAQSFRDSTVHPFRALLDPANIQLVVLIGIGIFVLVIANFIFQQSGVGNKLSAKIERLGNFGAIFIRLAVAAALFYSAYSQNFLGPELSLNQLTFIPYIRIVLYLLSALIALGLFSEAAGLISIIVLKLSAIAFGAYLFNYLSYVGEFLALIFFGSGIYSLDYLFFKRRGLWTKLEWEQPIIRISYGLALLYAAVYVKFLHPAITLAVVNGYDLPRFHFLFPHDPLLIVLGAGIVEALIGLCIIFGFQTRLVVTISLFYLTLSLFLFGEAVWPHLILFGASLYLLVTPSSFSIDNLASRLWYNMRQEGIIN